MTTRTIHPADLEVLLESRVAAARERRARDRAQAADRRRQPESMGRPRRRSRGGIALVAGTLLTLVAASVYGVVTTVNIEVSGRTGYAAGATDEGAIVEYIGDQHTTFGSSGSGIFDSFVRLQANDNEKGYNTDGDLEFDTKSGAFTHSIKVSDIPIVPCESLDGNETGTGLCWELFADLNESDSTKQISLDDLEVYFTTDPEITDYNAAWGAPVFSSDDKVEINDVNQGSGRGDLRYLVPVTGITIPSNCDYGDATCATYFVLYSSYGDVEDFDGTPGTSTYDSDGGFEEWKVKRYPFLDIEKTATTSFTRTFGWTIDKSADPATWDLFDGDSGTSDWTVALTKDAGTDSGWAVSGTITIENPSDQDAVIASVTDVVSGVGSVTPNCGVTFPYILQDGDSLVCTYASSLPDGTNRTNTATATLADGPVFDDDADVTFGSPTTLVNDTVDVTDTNGMSWNDVADDFSDTYDETFACGADEGTHTNTATITQTGQSDSATVTVTCYGLDVTKDASTSLDRDFDWTIAKTRVFATGEVDGDLDPATVTIDPDQTYTLTYEITVGLDDPAFTDANWAVAGTITVNNPAPIAADDVVVSDQISGYGDADSLDCDAVTAGEQTTVDIAANSSVKCAYSSALPDGTNRTNTGTATLFGIGYSGDATVDFSTADVSDIDECVVVTDDSGTLDDTDDTVLDASLCANEAPKTYTNTIDVGPFEVCGEYPFTNTADIVAIDDDNDTGESHSASYLVTIDVPCPEGCTLTLGYWKTHNESFLGGAPADENWFLIGDIDGDGGSEGELEGFFGTGDSWYDVFWTNVAGRPYYQLAHQWMAAYLNKLSIEAEGGTIPAEVQDALDDGAVLLDQYDANTDLKGKAAKNIRAAFVEAAGILAAFNEGDIGPGHCDEDGSSATGILLPPLLPARRRRLA